MSIIAGLRAKNGYLFVTSNITGDSHNNGDIVKLSEYCGALIVTKEEQQLKRVKEILNKCLPENIKRMDGLSNSFIRELILFFKTEFKKNLFYKARPLPFLLLIIGNNLKQQGRLEYVFIRNRITEVIGEEDKKKFVTEFDINPPIPAKDIFYGDSNVIQYLAQQLPCWKLPIDAVKLLAYLSISEFQHEDDSLSTIVKMAYLSAEASFRWIDSEEILLLAKKAKKVNVRLTDGLNRFLSRENLSTRIMKEI